MNENLYGGISYPNSSFIFDAVYSSYSDAMENANKDGILIGRYVLIAYSDIPISYDAQLRIINNLDKTLTGNEEQWRQNYLKDIPTDPSKPKTNYDRVVCKKMYNNGFYYKDLVTLTSTYSTDYIDRLIDKNTMQNGNPEITVVSYIQNIKDDLDKRDDTLEERIEVLETDNGENKNNISALQKNTTDLFAMDEQINNQINIWTGTYQDGNGKADNEKTIRTIANEEVAKIIAGADKDYDTLKEIADWIGSDENAGAAAQIESNKNDIVELYKQTSNLQQKDIDLENRTKTLEDDNVSHKTRLTNAENNIVSLQQQDQAFNNRVINLESDNTVNKNNISNLQTRMVTMEIKNPITVIAVETLPNVLEARMDCIYATPHNEVKQLQIIIETNGEKTWKTIGYTTPLTLQWSSF